MEEGSKLLRIEHLVDNMEHFDKVVDWIWGEWGKPNNYEYWKMWISSSTNKVDVPQTYVAFLDNKLVGTFSIWRCDLQSRQDLFPWFAGLYIDKEYRNRGIGKQLQFYGIKKAYELGYKTLFMFTELSNYYEKTGWEYIGNAFDEEGKVIRLYTIEPSTYL